MSNINKIFLVSYSDCVFSSVGKKTALLVFQRWILAWAKNQMCYLYGWFQLAGYSQTKTIGNNKIGYRRKALKEAEMSPAPFFSPSNMLF